MIAPAAAKRVKFVGLDVDGVLTDGGIYLGDADGKRVEFKRYEIQDGLGVVLMRRAGIKVGIITGRESESVRLRAEELQVDAVAQDSRARKLSALDKMLAQFGVDRADAAFVGDDLPDLSVLRAVGMPVAVANASKEVKEIAGIHLTRAGGGGAVREFAELLLTARGEWSAVVEQYVAATGELA
ncbi:MAG TPA: HAD-IIIA family hydrolase [Gemmatimonadaceae bacterium]|jgi:3-deoxy-D-manno-octulosonate 8-phosphate phosphatase (KDO 8-P phosphatase)